MKPWAAEVLEQAAIASLLGESVSPVMRRLGLIVADNAFEYALKAYVEFDSQILQTRIKYSDWEKDYKNSFERLTSLVLADSPNAFDKGTIARYHTTRNNLYHEPQPLTVDPTVCAEYISDLRLTVAILFKTSLDDVQWETLRTSARKGLAPTPGKPTGQVVEVDLNQECTDRGAICAVIQEFQMRYTTPPTLWEVESSLAVSGHAIVRKRISIRLSELRSEGYISRKANILTPKGRDLARKAITITSARPNDGGQR